jgi:hypothetical protein
MNYQTGVRNANILADSSTAAVLMALIRIRDFSWGHGAERLFLEWRGRQNFMKSRMATLHQQLPANDRV